ncbi:MAG: lysophospholipid acyltransferase family protein [Polyangiales bacterium]|nr:1-acyl-sn-glycerol-3-phosphate acyltransferase [Myxococcales bacterium]MCB9659272.1 1-acyl-sn-glycerol-3-phosphate acyltransferase [Sandaracinaceae bacterium]
MEKPRLSITLKTCGETLRVCVPTIAEAAFGPVPRERASRRLAQWAEAAVRHARIDTFVEGLEHVDPTRPHLVVSNHQSTYDIFVLMHLYPAELRMIAKKEMFRVPFVGGAMAAAEFVNIDRGDNARAREALEVARRRIESGINIWIAPEGTRSEDGRLLPFKTGGFMLALQTGIPILPVTVVGTQHVLPAKQVRVHPGKRAGLRFHAPVDPAAYGTARRDELMEHVRRTIDSGLPPGLQSYTHG